MKQASEWASMMTHNSWVTQDLRDIQIDALKRALEEVETVPTREIAIKHLKLLIEVVENTR